MRFTRWFKAQRERYPEQIAPHRTKRVSVKRGLDKLGQAIDETTDTVQTSSPGDDPEPDVEIEAQA
jgi:hypothetical protein